MSSPYLGLDIGLHHTGTALSESGLVARPLEVIESKPPHQHALFKRIGELVREHDVRTLVIGMPYTADGDPTDQSEKTAKLVEQIREELGQQGFEPDIVLANEIGSSQDGQHQYPGLDDHLSAATLILQDYLDAAHA